MGVGGWVFLVCSWRVPIGFGFFRECPPPPPLGGFEISVGGLRLPSRSRAPPRPFWLFHVVRSVAGPRTKDAPYDPQARDNQVVVPPSLAVGECKKEREKGESAICCNTPLQRERAKKGESGVNQGLDK